MGSGYKKRAIPNHVRREVAVAAGCEPGESIDAACVYCGALGRITWFRRSDGQPGGWVHFADLELDHVVAESRGGPATGENIVLACRSCNRRKATY